MVRCGSSGANLASVVSIVPVWSHGPLRAQATAPIPRRSSPNSTHRHACETQRAGDDTTTAPIAQPNRLMNSPGGVGTGPTHQGKQRAIPVLDESVGGGAAQIGVGS